MVDWRTDDRELLARILTAEAGNQGPLGMTAAGNVIMNRTNLPGYGGNLREVIMKPGQFSPMNSVTGYSRGEQGKDIDALRPSETAYMVADSLLQGTAGDITGGATHFYNPDISNPSWAQGVESKRIGDHVFLQAGAGGSTTQNTGATAMRQPVTTQREPAPMQQEQQQPGGLRGLLSNPDFYDRLAIGFGGLTLNPNQALMQASADRIAGRAQTRQDTAATNRTVEYLRSQGRDDLADAVASGSLSGKDAAAIMFQEPKERGQILSAAQMREMFPGTQIEEGLYNLKADGTANKVGGGGTTINMPGEPLKVLQDGSVLVVDATVPDGFRVVTPPGSPAEQEAEAAIAKAQMRFELAEASSDVVITAAQRAREAAKARTVSGVLGRAAAINPDTANAEIVRQVGTLQSMAASENINAMRQASPTGGALGNASDADILLLKQKSGALDPFSPNFERDLDDYERTLLRTIHGFEAGNLIYDQTRGGSGAATPTTPDTAPMSDEELLQIYGGPTDGT